MLDGAVASAALGVDGVGLSSCARPSGSRSCCAAAAMPALVTIRRWDAGLRPRWIPCPPWLSRSRRRTRARGSARPTSIRIAYGRRWIGCLARSRRRWPPVRQVLAATGHLTGYRTWSAGARSDAWASAGRPSRRRVISRQPWIGLRRARATFGSSGNGRRSADQPAARHCRSTPQVWPAGAEPLQTTTAVAQPPRRFLIPPRRDADGEPGVLKTRAAHRAGPGSAVGQPSCSLICRMPGVPKRCRPATNKTTPRTSGSHIPLISKHLVPNETDRVTREASKHSILVRAAKRDRHRDPYTDRLQRQSPSDPCPAVLDWPQLAPPGCSLLALDHGAWPGRVAGRGAGYAKQ